jgi:NitT/TauT family transport system substrate-binding protein
MIRSSFLMTSSGFFAATLPRPASAQTQLLSLCVAATANDTYAPAYYAQDMGFFTRAGLNVELQTLNNGAAIAAAVSGGAVDIGVATPITLAIAYLRGLPLVIVAAGALSTTKAPALLLGVSKTSAIRTAKDLEGKTVGENALGSGGEVNLKVWLAQNGSDISKVKLAETKFSEMGIALVRGTVDAVMITEPALTMALRQNIIQVIVDLETAIGPRYLNSCWFSTREFAQKNPELIRRFGRAIYDAQRWANGHHADSAAILAKYSKLDLDLVRSMGRAQLADELRPSDVQPFLDAAVKYGALARPVSAAELIYHP